MSGLPLKTLVPAAAAAGTSGVAASAAASPVRSDARGSPAGTTIAAPVVVLGVPPANDAIASATPIAGLPFSEAISTLEATTALDDPECVSNDASVWYALTPATTAWITADTFGSDYDTTLAAYTGTPGALDEIACSDDAGGSQSAHQLPGRGGRHLLPARGRHGRRREPRAVRRRLRPLREAPGEGHRRARGHTGGRAGMVRLGPGPPRSPLLVADGAGIRGDGQGQPVGDARLLRRLRRRHVRLSGDPRAPVESPVLRPRVREPLESACRGEHPALGVAPDDLGRLAPVRPRERPRTHRQHRAEERRHGPDDPPRPPPLGQPPDRRAWPGRGQLRGLVPLHAALRRLPLRHRSGDEGQDPETRGGSSSTTHR